jgi:signal transduction histidine kinase
MLSTDPVERQLLDALPISAYTLDLDGRVVSIHQPSARFGSEFSTAAASHDEQTRDRPLWDVAPTVFSRDQVERAMTLLRTGRAPIVRWEVALATTADGHVLLTQMTPLHDEAHAVTGFVVSATDVSSVHRIRETAIEASTTLARVIDLDRAFQEAAHHIRQSLRADLITIAVVDHGDVTSPRVAYHSAGDDDRRGTERRFAVAWREALEGQTFHTQRAGATWEITAPLVGQGEAVGVISIVVDDTESPEQLDQATRLLTVVATQLAAAIERERAIGRSAHQQRNHVIGEIASGIAQELRNPIFGISSAAQLLRFRAREDPVMEKNVGRILREVERLNRMVTTLVELGRPVTLKRSPGDPDVVWDDVLEGERGRLESRVVAVRRNRPRTPASAPIDAEQLAQAFRSVLSNAVEAAPEASDITLSSAILPNSKWRCALNNAGPPIPPEVLPRVFDLFVSTKPGSTGTGLAHARRIIEEHGGTIGIDSSADSGTTVTVTLPGVQGP